jgi:hypothetical protein
MQKCRDSFSPITLNSFLVWVRMSWAGRSAWNDRSVGIAEAAGSNPVPSTTTEPRPFLKRFSMHYGN